MPTNDDPAQRGSLDRGLVAGFHRTISDQLNARLGESPKFFWALVVASAGYGYVLWNVKDENDPTAYRVLYLASALAYLAVIWASWYLAALGYAFRFLQNCQHCIEHALSWDQYVPKGDARRPGEPPKGLHVFWLLPGIYHAHIFGLCAFLAIVVIAFCWHLSLRWPTTCSVLAGIGLFVFGLGMIFVVNSYYFCKFRRARRDPASVAVLGRTSGNPSSSQ